MPHLDLIITALLSSGVVASFAAFAAKKLQATAVREGAILGAHASSKLVQSTPLGLRAAVVLELNALAAKSDAAGVTANEAAAHILSRVAQRYPTVGLNDVLPIVGDFVHAFVAGLAVPEAPKP